MTTLIQEPFDKLEAINIEILNQITQDKTNEAKAGFDGAWAAHPDLVPTLKKVFEKELKGAQNQIQRSKANDIKVTAEDLLTVEESLKSPDKITEDGLRTNISATLQYTIAWMNGNGAVGIGYDPKETNIYAKIYGRPCYCRDISYTNLSNAQK